MTQTSREKREQLVFLAVMTVFGLVGVIGGLGYGLELEDRVGPGVMPFVAGLLMLLMVLVQGARRLRAPLVEPQAPEEPESEHTEADGPANPRLVAAIFVLIVLTVAATHVVGMLIAVSLLVGVLFLVNNRRKPWIALGAAFGAALFGWIVFDTLLSVPLPTGLLGLI